MAQLNGAPSRLMTVPEAADVLRCTPDHVYRLGRQGLLSVIRIGRSVFISPSDLTDYINRHRTQTHEALYQGR